MTTRLSLFTCKIDTPNYRRKYVHPEIRQILSHNAHISIHMQLLDDTFIQLRREGGSSRSYK